MMGVCNLFYYIPVQAALSNLCNSWQAKSAETRWISALHRFCYENTLADGMQLNSVRCQKRKSIKLNGRPPLHVSVLHCADSTINCS